MRLEIGGEGFGLAREEFDAGLIIHRDIVDDLVRVGLEVEGRMLARVVRWHLEDRILVVGDWTVVFE